MPTTKFVTSESPVATAAGSPEATEAAKPSDAARTERRRLLISDSATLMIFVIILGALSLWLGLSFLSVDARVLDVHSNAPLLVIGIGVCVCLVANQFDLSVGSTATLSAYLSLGLMANQHLDTALAIIIALMVGLAAGAVNALLVARLGINGFIATLGTQGAYIGLASIYSGGSTLTPNVEQQQHIPGWFTGGSSFGAFQTRLSGGASWVVAVVVLAALAVRAYGLYRTGDKGRAIWSGSVVVVLLAASPWLVPHVVAKLSLLVLALLLVAFVLWVVLSKTVLGRNIYATGGNPLAAELAGVHTRRVITFAYMTSGFCAALAGVLVAAIQGSVAPGVGTSFLLPAYAAAFLSTVLMSSGRFHIWGTVLGGALVVWIAQGLVLGGVPFTYTDLINGALLVGAVAVSILLRRVRSAGR